MNQTRIVSVTTTGAELDAFRDLLLEYAETLGDNTCFAGFDTELFDLLDVYGPPRGRIFLAYCDESLAGCVALRPLDALHGEMKRLYVRRGFRGSGTGRRLAETIIATAKVLGYRKLMLDTLPTMREAQALYRELGFTPCAAYYDNVALGSSCMELAL